MLYFTFVERRRPRHAAARSRRTVRLIRWTGVLAHVLIALLCTVDA
ncbi:hypothetical protein OG943_47905 [Amycolatopsis sp. NBC_00345]